LASKVDDDGRLVLCHGDLGEEAEWKSLGFFLAAFPSVCSLRLQGMEISKSKAKQLGQGGLRHIRSITFHGNDLGFNEDALEIIVGMLLLSDYLEEAQLVRNCLSDRHMKTVLQLLDKHSLKNLSLAWNGITDDGGRQIAQKLLSLDFSPGGLKRLDVSDNDIDKRGLRELRVCQLQKYQQNPRSPLQINWQRNKFKPPLSWSVRGKASKSRSRRSPDASFTSSSSSSPPCSSLPIRVANTSMASAPFPLTYQDNGNPHLQGHSSSSGHMRSSLQPCTGGRNSLFQQTWPNVLFVSSLFANGPSYSSSPSTSPPSEDAEWLPRGSDSGLD
jgi:hypothetical protein